jgi:sugar phosphate isomerase/epimerase
MIKKALAISPYKTEFAPLFFSGDIRSGIENAKKIGYDGVEISVRDPATTDTKQIRNILNDNGLEVVTIATGQSYVEDGLFLVTDNPDIKRKVLDRLKSIIDLAADLGSKNVTIGGIRGNEKLPADCNKLSLMVDNVAECGAYAEQNTITLLLEAINRYEVSTAHTAWRSSWAIKEIGLDNIKILYDTFHANIEETSICGPIVEFNKEIGLLHFADSNRLVPGYGHIDFDKVFEALKKINYQEYITVEALAKQDDMKAAKDAFAFMKKAEKNAIGKERV